MILAGKLTKMSLKTQNVPGKGGGKFRQNYNKIRICIGQKKKELCTQLQTKIHNMEKEAVCVRYLATEAVHGVRT